MLQKMKTHIFNSKKDRNISYFKKIRDKCKKGFVFIIIYGVF